MPRLSTEDEGKAVVNAAGDRIGVVSDVEQSTAYITPDPNLAEKLKARLGWSDADEDTHPLQEQAIETITSDEVRLVDDQ